MITVREVTEDDFPALQALLQAMSDEAGSGPVASVAALRQATLADPPLIHALIATDQGSACGMVIYYADYSTHRGEPGLYVQDIYVAPPVRLAGLARRLLAAAMARQTWGARYLTLGVSPANAAAVAAYARIGFRPRGYDFLILDGKALARLQG